LRLRTRVKEEAGSPPVLGTEKWKMGQRRNKAIEPWLHQAYEVAAELRGDPNLSAWEESFVSDIARLYELDDIPYLSEKQIDKPSQIHEHVLHARNFEKEEGDE
jgi:hypothetical protein